MQNEPELLDFEAPLPLSSYEKFLNYLESRPSYIKILVILLSSIFSALIVYYKATPSKDENPLIELMTVIGGFFILLMAIGFFLQILLAMIGGIIDFITNNRPKIGELGLLSITFLLAILSLISISILAIFIP